MQDIEHEECGGGAGGQLCVTRLKQLYAVALIIWIQFTHGFVYSTDHEK